MAIRNSRFAKGLVLTAAFAMTATPALARGWGGGWGGRHHDRDDTGWIVGGILGIGLIAAIAASANSKNKRDREVRDRDYDYRDGGDYRDGRDYRDYRDYRDGGRGYGERREQSYPQSSASRGLDGAVDSCVAEVERGSSRVSSVDSVDRDADGWRVEGRIDGGKPFSCAVGGNGRVRSATIDGRGAMIDEGEAAPLGG